MGQLVLSSFTNGRAASAPTGQTAYGFARPNGVEVSERQEKPARMAALWPTLLMQGCPSARARCRLKSLSYRGLGAREE